MSFTDDFLKELKKRGLTLEDITSNKGTGSSKKTTQTSSKTSSKTSDYTSDYFAELKRQQEQNDELRAIRTSLLDNSEKEEDDIAPVKKKEDSRLDFFQKGAFEDGYQKGDITRTILGTAGDIKINVTKGALGVVEGIGDLATYGVAGAAKLVGADEFARKTKEFAKTSMVEKVYAKPTDYFNENSILGRTSDAILQGVGQVGLMIGTGGLGAGAGLSSKAVTAMNSAILGASSFGSGIGEAYEGGATDKEAVVYGTIKGASDALSEMIFGGLGKSVNAVGFNVGLSSADDMLAKKVSSMFSNQLAKNLTEFGIKAGAEGFEEVIAGTAQAIGKYKTYMSEEEFSEILKDENLLEQFVVGAVTSGIMQSGAIPGMKEGSLIETTKTGRDFITGYSQNEQAVIKKEVENRIAEKETDGTKLSKKERSAIEAQVEKDMERGYISIDTIEETLGGETYKTYKHTIDSEDAIQKEFDTLNKMKQGEMTGEQIDRRTELKEKLEYLKKNSQRDQLKSKLGEEVMGLVKGDRLLESYNERSRRAEAFQADLAKYDEKQKAVVQKAVESGILNNTNRTHEFVDMVAKISADKGVLFDFTNNAKLKESGFSMEGKTINGYVSENGIAVNIQSAKSLNTVVGHEIAHVLEGTDLYTELQNAVVEYAKTKGDYQGRFDSLSKLYESVEGANIDAELTADLVGDYLFTDSDFINNLSTNHRNVFQKIYDEVKYLLKVATAGSKEARELERVKNAFEKAYRETKNTADSGVKYSIREDIVDVDGKEYNSVVELDKTVSKRILSEPKNFLRYIENNLVGLQIPVIDGDGNTEVIEFAGANETVSKNNKRHPVLGELAYTKGDTRKQVIVNAEEVIQVSEYDPDQPSTGNVHGWLDKNGWETRKTYVLTQDGTIYEAYLKIAKAQDGRNILYAVNLDINKGIAVDKGATSEKAAVLAAMPSGDKVAQNGKDVNRQFSISDSTGRQLSQEQAEYFKDSKVRDENGNLKVMYHGTPNGEFTVFKDGTYFTDSKAYADRYQNPGASSISTGKTASNPKTFEVYLDIKKPFDLSDPEARRIYVEEYIKGGNAMGINPYLSDAEYAKIETVDWMEGEDLRDFLIENEYDYDGLVLDEGADGGYGSEVQSRGNSYVVFSPEQVKQVDNAKPTGDPDIRFSLSETVDETATKSYAEITEEQQKLYQREISLRERKQEAVNNPELLQAMDDVSNLFDEMRGLIAKRHKGTATQTELDRIEELKALRTERIKQVSDLQESLGLTAIAQEETEIRETKEALRVAADAAWEREGAEKENRAIEKAGVPAAEYFRKKALKAFKTTTNFNEAGYLLPDGKMLNFSGGERNHRYRDHREIGEIYEATNGVKALNRFLRDGNIRVMAESPGIDLASGVEPTKEQYAALRRFINTNGVTDGQFFVDFSSADGANVGKYAYTGKIVADRIINDIKYFFQNGKVRESSGLLDFLSLSEDGAQQKTYGDYNVHGEDVALEAPVQEEVAPVPETAVQAEPAVNQTTVEDLFPDDTATVQEEYENLLAERDDIRGAMDIFAAVGDTARADQMMAEYEAVQARIAEIEADDADRLASIDEADAPPEVDNTPEDVADNVPLTKKLVDDLTRSIRAQLGLSTKRSNEVRELIQRYSNEEFPSKAHLYTEIAERFGTYTESSVDEDLKGVKALLRTYGINVDESIKSEIADYGQLMRRNFGKVRFSNDGLPVDVAYKEFQEALPGYFPDDVYAPTDQLLRILEVANMDTTMEAEYEIDVQTLEEVTDSIMNGVSEFKQNRKETLANQYGRESFNSLMENADQYAPPVTEDIAPVRQTRPAIESVQADPDDIAPVYETRSGQQSILPETEAPKKLTRKDLHMNIMDNVKTFFRNKGFEFDDVLKNAKDLSTFATVDNTPQRVMEKALGYKEGQALSDLTVNMVAKNETDGIKWLNSFTDKKTGLLAKISKQYGIKPGSKASAAAQMYAEGFYVGENDAIIAYGDKELAADFPNAKVQENIKKLARDPRIRQIYDETLAAINKSRTRNAYPEIPRLDNYFLHFRAMEDTFSRLGLPFNPNDIRAKDLPTDLNGVTADLKPGQPYFASAMHRTGKRTSFDLLGGLENYLTSAKNQIYHIDDIQKLRALRNYVAETYGQANGLQDLDLLSDEEAEQRIEQVYNSHLSTFAKFLNEEANVLAGKTSLIDRGLEGVIGRRGMTFMNTLNKQVGANMVGYNVSSSLTNFLAPVQAFAKTNKFDFVKAMAQTSWNKIASIFGGGDGFAEQSPVMIRRKGAERFYRTPYQKVADAGYVFMGVVDDISTELIARTKYNEFTRKGMSPNKAHYETDKWVSRLMGDRSLGQQPQIYNSKTLGLITKFQLEVRNQLDSQFYDTIQEAKVSSEDIQNGLLRNAKKAAKITSTFAQLAVMQHLFGKAFESVAGYNPAFDIIDVLIKTFGWDDEEDDEDTVLDNIEEGFQALLGDLPYTSVLTGGRIPISSALPVTELIKGKDQNGNDVNRWDTVKAAAPYYLLPGGYGQIKKTVAGLNMFDDDLPIAGSYTDSGNLRFPIEDTLQNRVKAGLFGQWASENARDYFDNERKPLAEKQIQEFIDVDIPIQEYWDYREGLAEHDKTEDKIKYIEGLDLPVSKKNILVNNVSDRKNPIDLTNYDQYSGYEEFDFASKNPEKYDFLQKNNISYADYMADEDAKEFYDGVYTWEKNYPEKVTVSKAVTDSVVEYRQYSAELDAIRADKDKNGKSISGSAKAKKLDYINSLDLDYGAKLILFKNEYNADDTYNYEIIDYLNGRDDISRDEMITILKELSFEVHSDGTVTW